MRRTSRQRILQPSGELIESIESNGTALQTNDYDSLGKPVSLKDPFGKVLEKRGWDGSHWWTGTSPGPRWVP